MSKVKFYVQYHANGEIRTCHCVDSEQFWNTMKYCKDEGIRIHKAMDVDGGIDWSAMVNQVALMEVS